MSELDWRPLVEAIRRGNYEPEIEGETTFIFWPTPPIFISDRHLIDGINQARGHEKPFVLIGAQNTGKGIFLNLVARGKAAATGAVPFVDENLFGYKEQDDVAKFFGRGGVADRNRQAIIHFDFMERAVGWRQFVEKLHRLAIRRELDRLDGRLIPCPHLRVVFGANKVPLEFESEGLFAHLYLTLSRNQYATTRSVRDQPDRLSILLAEMLAARVLDGATEAQARRVESVPRDVLDRLQDEPLPNEFSGLQALVSNATTTGDWNRALAMTRSMNPSPAKKALGATHNLGAVTTGAVDVVPSTWPSARAGSMYNLLISGNTADWNGTPFVIEKGRFLEFTDAEVRKQFDSLSATALARLVRMPCLFGYEVGVDKDPLFGVIRRIVARDCDIRIEYQTFAVSPFLGHEQLRRLGRELRIQDFEFGRTHWAIKEVSLQQVLASVGITLPSPTKWRPPVNVANHHFDLALSFPGEVRPFVKSIAELLEGLLGSDRCFYDDHYKAQLAQPNLDLMLQEIYRDRSRLIVVFLCEAYERKEWCANVEFRAIRDIIKKRDTQRIMFVRMDEGAVKGTFSLDGAIDASRHSAEDVAHMIRQRVDLLP